MQQEEAIVSVSHQHLIKAIEKKKFFQKGNKVNLPIS
jgi:hypothetical protein